MAKEQDRKEIVSRIGDAAKLYRDRLVGKRFMYVFDGRYIEVIYKAENFRHLTGVETFLSAKRFYSYAARKILTADQIGFNAKHPYDLCVRKVEHIGEVATMAGSESFLLEEIKTDTQSYKFGTTVSPSRKNGQEKCEKSRMKQTGANESKVKRQKLHTAAFQNRRAISIQSKSEDELCCRKLQYKQRYRSVPPAWSGSGADEPAHISDS